MGVGVAEVENVDDHLLETSNAGDKRASSNCRA